MNSNKSNMVTHIRSPLRSAVLLIPWLLIMTFAGYTSDHVIINGGTGLMSGYLAPAQVGEERLVGSVSVIVGQPFVSAIPMTGSGYSMELGFWTQMLRPPGRANLTASYEIFPDRIDLDWSYDPNTPPATIKHNIYRNDVIIRNDYPVENTGYTDDAVELNVGTEYSYKILGKNSFGWTVEPTTAVGKTSTVGSVSGNIATSLGTKIPNAKLTLTPNWGTSLYFNGTDDYATVPDGDEFEIVDNTDLPEATVEFWLRPTRVADEALISKGSHWEIGLLNLSGYSKLIFKVNEVIVMTSDATIGVDEWTHIALVKTVGTDGNAVLKFFINGQAATINSGQTAYTLVHSDQVSDIVLIGKSTSGLFFRGNLDDLLFWNEARSATDLARDYNRYLYYQTLGEVNYPHMTAQFNMDGGSGSIVTNAVDQTKNGTIASLTVDTWSTAKPPVYATAYTDLDGNYQINNINYGSGVNFTLTPTKEYHDFNPTYRLVYLADATPVANGQNFTVTNLMSITGFVYYDTDNTEGIQCGESNVQIWVNGVFKGVMTDKDGFYRVEVEPGADVNIKPYKVSREMVDFSPYSTDFTNVIINRTANFIDLKTRTIRGTVTGGICECPLGPRGVAKVELRPSSGLFNKSVTVDASGNYFFLNLPPQSYQLVVNINETGTYNPAVPELIAMDEYFANSGKSVNTEESFSQIDSLWIGEEDTIVFNYRTAMQTSITGFPINELGHKQFRQNVRDTLDLFAFERYWDNFDCPVDSGTYKIVDLISDRSDTVSATFSSDGLYRYGLLPGQPNISPTGSPPYSKSIEVIATDNLGRPAVVRTARAVVLGHKPQQMDFTTTAPDIPFLILRRPPGDQSVSEFTSSQSQCTEIGFTMGTSMGYSQEYSAKLGVGVTTSIGWIVATELDMETTYEMTSGISASFSASSNVSQKVCLSCETSYSTSDVEEVLGNRGDLFVGGALNLLYGETKVLDLIYANDVYQYALTSEVIFVPDGFATTFVYTRGYIEDYLVPELEFLAMTDSTMLESVRRWNNILAREDSLRWIAEDTVNYSFEGGAGAFSMSRTSEVEKAASFEIGMEINTEFAQKIGFSLNDAAGFEFTTKFNFGFNMGFNTSSTQTNSNTSSFTLEDDDFGDDYSVSVGSDPVYGTPVFHVIAGNSSCPYETWYNEEGTIVTTPRDVPYMEWQAPGGTISNILPDDVALLSVLLRNDQDEERTYFLSFVESSNPLGADVSINGGSDPIPYTLAAYAADSAQIAVWCGPDDYYEYENLQLKFAPECEANYAGVTDGFTLPFTVNFARPCTEAEIYDPSNNWVININNNDTLDIVTTGFDLKQSHFDQLWLQYRPLGGDAWFTINDILEADTLRLYNMVAAVLRWPVGDLLDGIYDIRLRSICLEGLLTNELPPLRGTIDRVKPTVIGAPEPTDQVLNMNDEIAVNLTEAINPATVLRSNVILYDGQAGGQITDIEVSVSNERIVIIPQIHNSFLENHFVEATIFGFEDMYGNPGDTIHWSFQVNRNPIAWNVPATDLMAIIGETNQFSIPLNNIGSSAKAFEITDLPEWLTANPKVGEINPGGSFNIQFTIDPNLNVGEFSVVIYAATPDGREPLAVNVVSMCPYPVWAFEPRDYQYSMNVTARIFVKGTQSLDEYDRLGAFVNGECRGLINIEHNVLLDDYIAYLTVYSDEYSGDIVDFHVWDRTGCTEYWQVDTTLIFTGDTYAGTPMTPLALNANGAVAQELALTRGYTWFSFNLESELAGNLDSLFSDFRLQEGDRLIGLEKYAQYSLLDKSWSGPLAETGLQLGRMYYSDLDTANTLDYVGFPVGPDTIDIAIANGWNWVGYLPSKNFNINDALYSLNSGSDDLVKDQFSYAQYLEGYGWIGSLRWLRPGYGYKLWSAAIDTLVYPTDAYRSFEPPPLARFDGSELPKTRWQANPNQFRTSMTATLLLESDTVGINDPADAVAAFVGDEVRGVARPIYVPALEQYRVFLMIYGTAGETISLKIHEAESGITYQANEIFTFRADDIIGNPAQPVELTRAALRVGDYGYVPDVYSLSQNFPNPFNPNTKLGFGIPEDARVKIRIFNLLGQEVRTLVDENLTAGYRYVVWNSTNEGGRPVTSGVYIVVMESKNFREVRKMVLLK
ncbi:MAG: LamG-like jellyroll fold domain-containing protein [Candidatus Neomarinimicrobiota bacterium]